MYLGLATVKNILYENLHDVCMDFKVIRLNIYHSKHCFEETLERSTKNRFYVRSIFFVSLRISERVRLKLALCLPF